MVPRILYLTTHDPYGEIYGAQLRAFHIGQALSLFSQVTRVMVKVGDIPLREIDTNRDEVKTLKLIEIPDHGFMDFARRNISLSIRNSFKLGCDLNNMREFKKMASEVDLIWFYGLRIPSALELDWKTRTFIDIDDIPSKMRKSQARYEPGWSNKAKLNVQVRIWRLREARIIRFACGVGVSSDADRVYLGAHPSIHVIPNGILRSDECYQRQPAAIPRIGFIGTFNYYPNSDGMKWFISNVWPRIKEQYPAARLRLVGSGTDGALAEQGQDVDGLGYLKDLSAEISSWAMMVIPIFVGAGTRIKILEGFSRQCPVVSTSLGAYGYNVLNKQELLVADTIEDFTGACLKILQQPLEASKMAERAQKKYLDNWTGEVINHRVREAAENCLRPRPGA